MGYIPYILRAMRTSVSVQACTLGMCIWVVVKIMVPFWVPNIIRHLIFRVPEKGP